MHRPTLFERSYLTRTTMKQTNFSQRFDKPDFNLQKGYRGPTHSQNLGHIRIQSEIITHIRTAFSFRLYFNTSRNLPNKKTSQTAKSHLISQNLSLNLFLSTCQRKNCKKLPRQLPRLPQWIRTYPLSKPIFSRPAVGCERR